MKKKPTNQADFDAVIDEMPSRRRNVFKAFLEGMEEADIDNKFIEPKRQPRPVERNDKLDKKKGSPAVRKLISQICSDFGIRNEEGERFSLRDELIQLCVQFKPEWVCQKYREKFSTGMSFQPQGVLELHTGPISVKSPLYIQRDRAEPYLDILEQPGALLKICAPHKMGKTSLVYRILAKLSSDQYKDRYRVMRRSLQADVEQPTLRDLSQLLQWLCETVRNHLGLEAAGWSIELPTMKEETSLYFERYILPNVGLPLILILDDVDWLFNYPETAEDFFALLRGWTQNATTPGKEIWENLRIVVAYATEDYLNLRSSPFSNVGIKVELRPLTLDEIQKLARQHNLPTLAPNDISSLTNLVGGHPYLIQQAFYHLRTTSLKQILEKAPTSEGIYTTHLTSLSKRLEQQPALRDAFLQVLRSQSGVQLTDEQSFKLKGLGLVNLQNNQVHVSCDLYRQYFQKWI